MENQAEPRDLKSEGFVGETVHVAVREHHVYSLDKSTASSALLDPAAESCELSDESFISDTTPFVSHDIASVGSLDNDLESPPPFSEKPQNSRLQDLTRTEIWDIILLFSLYVGMGMHGAIVGGTLPILLEPYLPYGKLGLFSLTFYSYSLKLLWSPLVDVCWIERLGRRKSWIVPPLLIRGAITIALSLSNRAFMGKLERGDNLTLGIYIGIWSVLSLLSAVQSSAVDGWATSLLPPTSTHWASTAASAGLTCGHFVSYPLFLFLNPPKMVGRNLSTDGALLSLAGLFAFMGSFYCLIAVCLVFFKTEISPTRSKPQNILKSYKAIVRLICLAPVRSVIILNLVASVGFQVNDTATDLKLLDRGFGQENLAGIRTINMPFEIIASVVAGILCVRLLPLRIWCWAFVFRLCTALLAQVMLMVFPENRISVGYYFFVVLEHVLAISTITVMNTTFFVFYIRVADPLNGTTFMALLATAQQIGVTAPRAIIMKLIEVTTSSACEFQFSGSATNETANLPTGCSILQDKTACAINGGTCSLLFDGYYSTNLIFVLIGSIIFGLYVRPTILWLQKLPESDWIMKE